MNMDVKEIRELATRAKLSATEANALIGDLVLELGAAVNNQSKLRKAHAKLAARLQGLVPLDRLLTAIGFESAPAPVHEEGERYGVDIGWGASDPDFDRDYEC